MEELSHIMKRKIFISILSSLFIDHDVPLFSIESASIWWQITYHIYLPEYNVPFALAKRLLKVLSSLKIKLIWKSLLHKTSKTFFETSGVGSAAIKLYDPIMKFVGESSQLQLKLTSVCVQVMNTKKNHFQNFYFRLLGNGGVHASTEKNFGVQLKRLRLTQMREALENLSGTKQRSERDLWNWKVS